MKPLKGRARELFREVEYYVNRHNCDPLEALDIVDETDAARDAVYSTAVVDEVRALLTANMQLLAVKPRSMKGLTRAQLNDFYEEVIGYRPDVDNGSPHPLRELRAMCQGVADEWAKEQNDARRSRVRRDQ